MTPSDPLRFRDDSTTPPVLRMALAGDDDEMPTDVEIGHLWATLSAAANEPARLKASSTRALADAFVDAPEDMPSAEDLASLRRSVGAEREASGPRRTKRTRTTAVLVFLLPALAAAAAGVRYFAERSGVHVANPRSIAPPGSVRPGSEVASDPSRAEPADAAHSTIPDGAAAASPGPQPGAPSPVTSKPRAATPRSSELALLEQANASLASDPARTLALTAEHARFYPGGLMVEEREVLAIDALTHLGRRAEAQSRAARFAKSHPGSAHLPRLRALLPSTGR